MRKKKDRELELLKKQEGRMMDVSNFYFLLKVCVLYYELGLIHFLQ